MKLFVRESGPVGAPAIVFLHGGELSSQSWQPVVERMQRYRCLVPDLPQHGKSFQQGPFEMGAAATAVAELDPYPGRHRSGARGGPFTRGAGRSAAAGDRRRNSSIGPCCAGPSSTRCRSFG